MFRQLGDSVRPFLRNDTVIKKLEIKNSVIILGVHFTYDSRAKPKLNFDEIVTSIKQKLHYVKYNTEKKLRDSTLCRI